MEHWVRETLADFGVHSTMQGLMKSSGLMLLLICGCWMGAELQPVSLV